MLKRGLSRSRLLVWGIVGAAAPLSYAAVKDSELIVQDYYGRAEELSDSLSRLSDADPEDRKDVVDHYNRNKRSYLVDPLARSAQTSGMALRTFESSMEKSNLALAEAFGNSVTVQTVLDSCWDRTKMSELKTAVKKYNSGLGAAVANLSSPFTTSRAFGARVSTWPQAAQSDFGASLEILDQEWGANAKKCCAQGMNAALEKVTDATQKEATGAKYQVACKQYEKEVTESWAKAQSAMQIAPPNQPPNPVESNRRLTTPQLANAIRTRSSALNHARREQDSSAEDREFAEAEAECRKMMRKKQSNALPYALGVLGTVSQIATCAVLPTLATQKWSLSAQQLMLSVATLPIPGLGCNPAELAPYWQARDPRLLDSKYGLTAMLSTLQPFKRLPMLTAGFTISQQADGSYVTPFGVFGAQTTASFAGAGGAPVLAASAANSGRSVKTTDRRVAASRGLGATRATRALAMSRGPSRALVEGSTLSRSARTLASDISRGKAPFKNASRLRSEAASARKAVSAMVTNNARQSPQQRRRSLASEAATVRTAARKLGSTRVSRTTNQGTLASLRGRTRKTTGGKAPPTGIGGMTYEDMKKNAEKARQIVLGKVRIIADNIQGVVDKAEQTRQQIFQIINQAEVMVASLYRDIIPLPPAQQAERVYQTRVAIAELHKQIAPLKIAHDAYASAILEQKAQLMAMSPFAPKGSTMPGLPSNLATAIQPVGTGSNDRAVNVSPKSTEEVPAPAGFPVRTTSLEEPSVLDWLNPIKAAWAANRKKELWTTDEEWVFEWDRLMKDWDGYLEGKEKEERKLASDLAQLVVDREKSVSWETVRDSDTDFVATLNLYSKTLEEETGDLITATDIKGPEQLNLDGNTIQELRKAREEARSAQEGLVQLALQYKEARPENDEDDPEAWWAVVPDLLVE